MMRMSGRVTVCCVALLLTLTSVSAIQWLNSINDLKKINFGQSVPKHSLLLLHWFANIVEIDNNVIRLPFDPNDGDYGSHHYGNYERMLDQLPYRHKYYTVGNLNQGTSEQLPDYVVHPRTGYDGRNRDRIIVRVREQSTGRRGLQIDRVFITQHHGQHGHLWPEYDPARTYEISTNLLRDIRQFSMGASDWSLRYLRDHFGSNVNDFQLQDISNTWGDLACLGLLLFIVLQEKYSSYKQPTSYKQNTTQLQNAARGNTQWDSPGFTQTRQDPWNGDSSEIPWVIFLVLFFLAIVIFSIFSSSR